MSGYFFLILTVLCFSFLGVLHKVADFRQCGPSAINAYLFLWAWLFMTVSVFWMKFSFTIPQAATAVAIGCGVSASVAILAFQTGIRFGKISTSWLIINLSTAVPTILSILFYGEHVGRRRGIALVAIALSLVFLWKDKDMEQAEKQRIQTEVGFKIRQ